MRRFQNIAVLAAIIIFFASAGCRRTEVPKPMGYFRIDMEEPVYVKLDSTVPYVFEYPKGTILEHDVAPDAEPYWINILYPSHNARVHLSYKEVDGNLYELLEDNIKLAYKHVVKADAIDEEIFVDEDKNMYVMLFEIKGDAASPLQFLATDSTRHFIRGSLYFYTRPNRDSLAPVIDYIKTDVVHLIETLEWKD